MGMDPFTETAPSTDALTPAGSPGSISETGTTVVGVRTADTIVLAADRRASLGGRFVTNKRVDKIEQVHPAAALALSGAVGHIQAFARILTAESQLYRDRRGEEITIKGLATLASNVLRTRPLQVAPILGGVDAEGPRLYSLDGAGGRLADRYLASGSGMQLAYGVLEREFEEGLSRDAGQRIAAQAVTSAGERDTASGDGLTIATIFPDGVEFDEFDTPEGEA